MSNFPIRRVVICAPGFPSSLDDSDKPFLLNHALALISAGFSVTVVCPSVPGLPNRQIVEGIQVTRKRYAPRRFETLAATGSMYREARGMRSIFALSMIVALIVGALQESRRHHVTVFHGHWWVPGGLVAVIAAMLTRTKSVVHLHGSDSVVASNLFMRWMARRVMRLATHRLAVSEALADWGEKVSSKAVAVCSMPLSSQFTRPAHAALSDGPVLAVGRLVHEKGFDVLIEAISRMDDAQRHQIVIVGEGPERSELKQLAVNLNVNLTLLGSLPPKDLLIWYVKCSFVVVPSRREGFGLVAAEAAAMGRAVIGSRVGGIPEVISHGVSGLLVEAGNIDELEIALSQLDITWGEKGPQRVKKLALEAHGVFLEKLYER